MSFKNEQEIKNEVERQYNILKRGCEEIINEHEFKKKLEKSISTNTPLRVKCCSFEKIETVSGFRA